MAVMGFMFFFNLSHFIQASSFQAQRGQNLTDGVIRPLYGNMNVILLFMVPFITMRLFAEERKLHTIELLFTSPLKLSEIVLGKFLSSMMLITVMLILTLAYPLILVIFGNPDIGPIFTNYIGITLMAGCYVAIGVLFSSVTENQIVAGALSFAGGLLFWLISWASQAAGPVWGDFLNYLSLITHNMAFAQGVINTSDVLYYVSFIGMGLFITHRVLDSYRWR